MDGWEHTQWTVCVFEEEVSFSAIVSKQNIYFIFLGGFGGGGGGGGGGLATLIYTKLIP